MASLKFHMGDVVTVRSDSNTPIRYWGRHAQIIDVDTSKKTVKYGLDFSRRGRPSPLFVSARSIEGLK